MGLLITILCWCIVLLYASYFGLLCLMVLSDLWAVLVVYLWFICYLFVLVVCWVFIVTGSCLR